MKAIYKITILTLGIITNNQRKTLALGVTLLFLVNYMQAQCNNLQDYQALRALYLATDGDNWNNNDNWPTESQFQSNPNPPVGTDMHFWHGINCDQGRVYFLNQNNNNLTGNIPISLQNLTFLEELNFAVNNLSGTIPTQLGNLLNLERLYLNNNILSGSIPSQLGNLSQLNTLYLSENNLSGSIPQQLGNLNLLTSLGLHENNLNGCIPENLIDLCNSQYFQSFANPLLPWQGDEDQFCNTNGSQQSQIGAPCDDGNSANGSDFIQDDCSCGPPVVVNSCDNQDDYTALRELYLSTDGDNWNNNNGWPSASQLFLNAFPPVGTDMDGWYGITCIGNRVEEINLPNNGLFGSIPLEIEELSELRILDLGSNFLDGELQETLGNLNNLDELRLGNNFFSGCIPTSYSNLCDIPVFNLSGNPLLPWQGDTFEFCNSNGSQQSQIDAPCDDGDFSNGDDVIQPNCNCEALYADACNNIDDYLALRALYLATDGDNWLNTIGWPSAAEFVSNLTPPQGTDMSEWSGIICIDNRIEKVELRNNNLYGNIPSEIEQLTELKILDLGFNFLEGDLPSSIANLYNIEEVRIDNNYLSGCIPSTYFDLCFLVFDLTGNDLLPWSGETYDFCNSDGSQQAQVGAPCDDGNASNGDDFIQEDCSCGPDQNSTCPTPVILTSDPGHFAAYFEWNHYLDHNEGENLYVEYRKTESIEWNTLSFQLNDNNEHKDYNNCYGGCTIQFGLISDLTLNSLAPDTEYELRIKTECEPSVFSDYSNIKSFRTTKPQNNDYVNSNNFSAARSDYLVHVGQILCNGKSLNMDEIYCEYNTTGHCGGCNTSIPFRYTNDGYYAFPDNDKIIVKATNRLKLSQYSGTFFDAQYGHYRIWIDYNNDKYYSPNEIVFTSELINYSSGIIEAEFVADSFTTDTKMRIIFKVGDSPPDAYGYYCTGFTYDISVTYDNDCINPELINNDFCPSNFDPVCGCNGITYNNPCNAYKEGVTSWIQGKCTTDPMVCGMSTDELLCQVWVQDTVGLYYPIDSEYYCSQSSQGGYNLSVYQDQTTQSVVLCEAYYDSYYCRFYTCDGDFIGISLFNGGPLSYNPPDIANFELVEDIWNCKESELPCYNCLEIPLIVGTNGDRSNFISSCYLPVDRSIETIFNQFGDKIASINDENGNTWTIGDPNCPIENWEDLDAFNIILREDITDNTTIEICGLLADPESITDIKGTDANGNPVRNYIGFPFEETMPAIEAFESVDNLNLMIWKTPNMSQTHVFGTTTSTLDLKPGNGYILIAYDDDQINYRNQNYIDNGCTKYLMKWNSSPYLSHIRISEDLAAELNILSGNEIAITNDEDQVIASHLYQGQSFTLTLEGYDRSTLIDEGFSVGESINIKVWNPNSQLESNYKLSQDRNPLVFEVGKHYQPDGMEQVSNVINDEINPFVVYPNPFTHTIRIHGDWDIDNHINIYDIQGKSISHYPNKNGKIWEIDLNNLPKGVYILEIRTDDIIQTEKIVKQ